MSLIKASLAAGVRPTTMILGEDNRKPWSHLDVLIMQAYQIVKDEQCSQCGLPRWLCRNSDPRLQVKVKFDDCYASNEVKKEEKKHVNDDSKSGVAYPEFYSTDDTPLSDFRSLYYEQLAAERAEEVEDEDD
ncbi:MULTISPECIES: hypothetical protein [unclassified Microbacterium]|uniref:hypothetical protein n=1 Tax=unclassified Microbacterium TaxID=2609290 RepID=UPI000EA8AFD4|nr:MULTISPECIES: hypothetical protein [unclassified Microbacterium]MBT2484855.1 hypothetical protein [Microbacterium sp. ISL-108]RKN67725.1 hypothetical protein D7252_09060 [Microbacterium sp. CGR2]